MLRRFLATGLLLVCPLTSPPSFGQAPKKPAAATPAAIDADKLGAGEFVGKLVTLPSNNSDFTIEVITQQLALKNPNQKVNQAANKSINSLMGDLQRIQQLEQQLSRAKNAKEASHVQGQLNQAISKAENAYVQAVKQSLNPANNPFKLVTNKTKVEFHVGDDLPVRLLQLPVEFDDKGKPKKYTADEIKALKGDNPKLPGYEGKLENLKVGMLVKVALGRVPVSSSAADKDKASKEELVKDTKDSTHKTEVKILLVVDPSTGVNTMGGGQSNGK